MTGRQQGLVRKPSQAKSRNGGDEFGYDHFGQQRHDARDEQPFRHQKHLSSHNQVAEGIRPNREREIPSNLPERREYEWHMRRGRDDQVHSRLAPPMGRSDKRPYVDEMVLRMNPAPLDACRGNDYAEYEDYNNETIRKPKHGYGYGYGYGRGQGYDDHIHISKQEYSERRFMVDSEHGAMVKSLVPEEGRVDSQPVRVRPDRRDGQSYGQSSQNYSTLEMQRSKEPDHGHGQSHGKSSQSYSKMEMRRSKEENDHYQEVMPPENLYKERYYEDKDKHLYQSRNFSHSSPTIQYKDAGNEDFGNNHLRRGTPSTSSGVIRDDFQEGFQDVDIHPFDEYPRKPEKLSETLGTREYNQRPSMGPRKEYEIGYEDMKWHHSDPYGCMWNEHEDYAYVNVESRGKDDPSYISCDGLYREDSAHARADSEHRYIQRPAIAKPFAENLAETEGSYRICIDNGLREFDSSQKEVPGYVDLRRAINTSIQDSDCLESGYAPAEFARRASQDLQLNEARVLHEHEMSAYDHERYVNVAQGERVKCSPERVDLVDMQRLVRRENRYADEQVADNRMFKRKYLHDEEGSGFGLGTTVSHKWNKCNFSQQMGDCRTGQINISSSGLHSKVPSRHEPNPFLEDKDMMDEIRRHKSSVRCSWSDQGKWKNMQEKPIKSLQPGRKYMKVHGNSESSKVKVYGRSHYINHRSHCYKKQYFDIRNEDNTLMDVAERDDNLSEDLRGRLKYDLYEDSEGFKQNVFAAFLIYSKKLNENPPVRKLYKDQGKSGTLFCIVCGRSVSKVFRDADGLAKHAFMSHKASLRAQHLGLNKAICVLMGWNTEVPGDTITWVPQALRQPEAMAQKEDLILWQPTVIVHNISLSNANHKEWKVINLEALEDIVRAKSFIRSRIKICLGYPGDQSVMLVKFMGTFTGLQEAEKLHNYFAEKGRGRAEFELAISDMSKGIDPVQNTLEEITEESLLYGYMGIAEDLDRVDFDTKKRCQIKSKKEIQGIADAPLKAE